MENKNFEITSRSWKEVADKIDEVTLEDILNDNIDLEIYGKGVQKIYFVFLAVHPNQQRHDSSVDFDVSKMKISASLKLSYPHLLNASKKQSLSMMASLFVEAINLYSDFEISDFDFVSLKKDISQLFFEKGFIE